MNWKALSLYTNDSLFIILHGVINQTIIRATPAMKA